ncbi:MAG: hypothetical protein AAGD07_06140 [Planctomycetota bacterium]
MIVSSKAFATESIDTTRNTATQEPPKEPALPISTEASDCDLQTLASLVKRDAVIKPADYRSRCRLSHGGE